MRVGLIARADQTGLGNQTRNLAYMLKPSKILVVDGRSFSKNQEFHSEWYNGFNAFRTKGFPTNAEVTSFLKNIDVLITCETFYNPMFISMAKAKGIKTILQYNYEFLDHLQDPHFPRPDVFVAPSTWKIDDVEKQLGVKPVYLPPPTDLNQFTIVRKNNMNRHDGVKRFLHVLGRDTKHHRNGTDTLIQAVSKSGSDFELVIKTQFPLELEHHDPRIRVQVGNPANESDLYLGFDAMIMPRKFAGLCLPMNEALMSGLPVIMTDVSPNNYVLPKKWLADTYVEQMIMVRTLIECHAADLYSLASRIDYLVNAADLDAEKAEAFEIGYNNFSYEALKPKWEELING